MDRYRWLKSMTQFSNVYGAYPVNNNILFFDGHGIHFGDGTLRKITCKKIQPFFLKSGDSINDQPNDNDPNSKLKSLYNVTKSTWLLNYGTTKFSPHHMNSVLVEVWDASRAYFQKLCYPPHPPWLNNKYPGMCCLHLSIFWSQG